MNKTIPDVDVTELRRLLFDLKDRGRGVCIRFRLMGEMWQPYHSKVLNMTEKGGGFIEEKTNKLFFIQDLNNVMQFELDEPFQNYKPHLHYTVKIS